MINQFERLSTKSVLISISKNASENHFVIIYLYLINQGRIMKKHLMALFICLSSLSTLSFAITNSDHVFITIGSDALQSSSRSISNFEIVKEGENGKTIV